MPLPPCGVSERTRPSSSWMRRGHRSATACSCVMTTMVAPRRCSSSISAMICCPVALSRFPVGSSASTIAGEPTSARAIATRCRSPPDSCVGREWRRSPRPTAVERFGCQLAALCGRDARVQKTVGDVLEQRRVLGEEELLEHEPDPRGPNRGELAVGQLGDVQPGDAHASGRRALERSHQMEQRRLPGAGRADDRDEFARGDAEADALQRRHRRIGAVCLRDVLERRASASRRPAPPRAARPQVPRPTPAPSRPRRRTARR